MMLSSFIPDPSLYVTDIVTRDYRTADIFRKYDIDFCCGGKWPLEMICKNKGLDTEEVLGELKKITSQLPSRSVLEFDKWELDFLADYIVNIHHLYLKRALPEVKNHVSRFLDGHTKKFPGLAPLNSIIDQFQLEFLPHMKHEEEIIFPYIKQIHRAFYHHESYASLLVRTLRKPVEEVMKRDHETTGSQLHQLRQLTENYTPPENACLAHKVAFAKLRELDEDLVRHIHLENNILFPKALAMEKELLK